MEQVLVLKTQVYITCWVIALLCFLEFIGSASQSMVGLSIVNAFAAVFWAWWPFRLVKEGRKRLACLAEEMLSIRNKLGEVETKSDE